MRLFIDEIFKKHRNKHGESNMSSSIVKIKLNESQELKFKLHVQGSTSEPDAQNPQFRFVLTEKEGTGLGLIFPVKKEENGTVSVCIPSMDESIVKENKQYVGKMEVLMGSRYFTPTVLNIVFEKEFKITAEAITSKKGNSAMIKETVANDEETSINSEYVQVVSTKNKPVVRQTKPFKITAEDIKEANGSDVRLKAIISKKVSDQIPAGSKDFHLYVEAAYKNVKTMLLEQRKNKVIQTKKFLDDKDKIGVEDLMGVLFKNKS